MIGPLRVLAALTLKLLALMMVLAVGSLAQTPTPEVVTSEPATETKLPASAPKLEGLSPTELCKTAEGREFLFTHFDPIALGDLQSQWEGSIANQQPIPGTFDEFARAALKQFCDGPSGQTWTLPQVKISGTCGNPKIEPPAYDSDAAVERAQALDEYFRTSSNPDAGATFEERIKRRDAGIILLLKTEQLTLSMIYRSIVCRVGVQANCVGSIGAGQKRCPPTYLYAPGQHEFVPGSLKATGSGVKNGPTLESPTKASFVVGKTGGGENVAELVGDVMLTENGAKERAVADVDVIRRELIKRGLPVDRTPARIPTPSTPSRPTSPPSRPTQPTGPAKIIATGKERPREKQFFEIKIINTGASPATVRYRVDYFDGFFTTKTWKLETYQDGVVVYPGTPYEDTRHRFSAEGWKFKWEIVSP